MGEKKTIRIKGKVLPYYPRILTNDGSEPRLDIPVAVENLSLFKDIAGKYKLPFLLIYGTLLGAVREQSFLPHDSDTDLTIDRKHEDVLLEMIPEMEKAGLLLIRYEKLVLFGKGIVTYSFMKNGMWIDIYMMQKTWNSYMVYGKKYPRKHFDKTDTILFYDCEYLIPHDPGGFLAYVYGVNWRVPKSGEHGSPIKHILRIRFYFFLSKKFSKIFFIKNVIKKITRLIKWVT